MADYTAVKIDDVEAIYGGAFKRVRGALGVSSFGMQVIDMPANATQYPEHDHSHDGQEEVYVVLRGGGAMEIDGERVPLDGDTIVRVGPGAKRKVLPGDSGVRLLIVGGAPGQLYEAPEFSEIGAPDPAAA